MRIAWQKAGAACALMGLAAGLASAENKQPASDFLIHNGDRVVFFGDSITDTEWYPVLVESYVLTRYPKWRNYFSNRGVSGDGSHSIERFQRDVVSQKPNLCIYNMGYNDGGYFSFQPQKLEKYLQNIEQSVALAREADPKMRMVLASPIPNEVTVSHDPRWVSREVYPYVMLTYGAEEGKLAQRLGLPFIDLGLLYGQSMGLGKVVAGDSFNLSRDGVHPQREGQTLIAYHMLRGLEADSLVANVSIDAGKGKVEKAQRCTISDLAVKDGTISFRRQSESLPCPVPPEARPFAFLVRMDDNLNADMLKVSGLTAQAYTLFLDDRKIADVSAAELAVGINLSRYANTPMNEQALAVMEAVRAKQLADCAFFRDWIWINPSKADGNRVATDKAEPADLSAMDEGRKKIADLEAAAYALNTPKPVNFKLSPSEAKVTGFDFLAAADIAQPRLDVAIQPIEVDWNSQSLSSGEIQVKIKNPSSVARSGTVDWSAGNGWTVTPEKTAFTVDAGKETVLGFAVSLRSGASLAPPPRMNLTWRWSDAWPYPMTLERYAQLAPKLTIPKATVKPSLGGKLEDWKDAVCVVLDQPYYVDPAVPGKKLLWNGPKDLSGQFFLKWDDTAFYIAALVRDDEHIQNANKMMAWSQDSLGISFFAKGGKGTPDGRKEIFLVAYPDRDEVITTIGAAKDDGPAVNFASKKSSENGTCFYEAVVPWSQIKAFAPGTGQSLRFTFTASDADSALGKGFNYLAWTPGIHVGKYTDDFGTVVLGDAKPAGQQ